MANSPAIEVRHRDGKTYYAMVDAVAFQEAVGRLLAEVQRIKAEGDYEAAKALFETYGVHFDAALRDEVVARVEHLNMPSYTGFVQPRLEPVIADDGDDHRRHDLVSAGPDDADAGVFGPEAKMRTRGCCCDGGLARLPCMAGAAQRHSSAPSQRVRRQPRVAPAAALPPFWPPRTRRLELPDDLHTPGIDTLRAKQMEDLRLLLEFARSKDSPTQIRAIRALGRLERREVDHRALCPILPTAPDRPRRHRRSLRRSAVRPLARRHRRPTAAGGLRGAGRAGESIPADPALAIDWPGLVSDGCRTSAPITSKRPNPTCSDAAGC